MAELPNPDQMEAFLARKDDGPVVMLNLLKFKPDGGAERYAEYGAAVGPLLAKVEGKPVYAGNGSELLIGTEDWDMVLMVQYPSRGAMLDMIMSDEYRAVQHLRDEAIVRSVLLATDPAAVPAG